MREFMQKMTKQTNNYNWIIKINQTKIPSELTKQEKDQTTIWILSRDNKENWKRRNKDDFRKEETSKKLSLTSQLRARMITT